MFIGEVYVMCICTFMQFEQHLMELDSTERFALIDIEIYYKAKVIKTVWH